MHIVKVMLLNAEKMLSDTLPVNGGHDPLLDKLANMMHTDDRGIYKSLVHVC